VNLNIHPTKRFELTVHYEQDGTESTTNVSHAELIANLRTHNVPVLTAFEPCGVVQMQGGPRLTWKPAPAVKRMPECVNVFMRLTELAARGEAERTVDGLREYMTDDDEVAHRQAWSLASIGTLIAGHALRRFYQDQGALQDNDLFIIETLPGADEHANPNALAMSQAVIQHANAPQGAGTEYATDIIAAHVNVHGAGGMIEFLVELIKFNVFLWGQGVYKTDAERAAENGDQS
jgi:hypothetical protein